ncbi:hypothetical protein OIU84_021863 [Salix udensis]|uniref:Uncharacterized protein n=1 Tax=Salix udensis TaxID=889485 RepID=A0AAD6KVZ5_9ROSI|nr:hypothetical protein OIU84_021863 [Salix udensis]
MCSLFLRSITTPESTKDPDICNQLVEAQGKSMQVTVDNNCVLQSMLSASTGHTRTRLLKRNGCIGANCPKCLAADDLKSLVLLLRHLKEIWNQKGNPGEHEIEEDLEIIFGMQ